MNADTVQAQSASPDSKLPPVDLAATASLALIVIGGIYLASYIPRQAPLGPAIGLVAAALALMAWNAFSLARLRNFDWDRFNLVAKWGLLAYMIETAFLEYVFVDDGVRGGTLVVLSLMLFVFATSVPLIIAFSVVKFTGAQRAAVET